MNRITTKSRQTHDKRTTNAHLASNVHPNYRALGLAHIAGLRCMIRDGHPTYRREAHKLIKKAQLAMLISRRRLASVLDQ